MFLKRNKHTKGVKSNVKEFKKKWREVTLRENLKESKTEKNVHNVYVQKILILANCRWESSDTNHISLSAMIIFYNHNYRITATIDNLLRLDVVNKILRKVGNSPKCKTDYKEIFFANIRKYTWPI